MELPDDKYLFSTLIYESYKEIEENSNLRLGQIIFNKLYKDYPEVADFIRGTSTDMFHLTANEIDNITSNLIDIRKIVIPKLKEGKKKYVEVIQEYKIEVSTFYEVPESMTKEEFIKKWKNYELSLSDDVIYNYDSETRTSKNPKMIFDDEEVQIN